MYPNNARYPRLTKAIAEQCISQTLRIHPHSLKFVKLTEQPREWKHACVTAGVVISQPIKLPYYTATIEFTFCRACGNVVYYYEELI